MLIGVGRDPLLQARDLGVVALDQRRSSTSRTAVVRGTRPACYEVDAAAAHERPDAGRTDRDSHDKEDKTIAITDFPFVNARPWQRHRTPCTPSATVSSMSRANRDGSDRRAIACPPIVSDRGCCVAQPGESEWVRLPGEADLRARCGWRRVPSAAHGAAWRRMPTGCAPVLRGWGLVRDDRAGLSAFSVAALHTGPWLP